ncbi:MAG: tRNA (adenosine(37)-N6)-threonylcarbamoyltransferase complex transferase subunit TsaD [Phycisphaerae bacterium]|jgi:N6-L-threonylcarbamoyladenine synthase|nr:tRNA (adenosine(37)-N6)-threonylcarbamoyltransferase complex transferase subunit TsaD [Phycisphaerae bacterium]MBT6270355.1 tRNA (adenosine(37)-N6)-threonylcarbamoyltransferase complex transferase subunit TsaD [Phycisphaerae bacterium]
MTLILGIESSCDETAASVVKDGCEVLSNVVASQDELHIEYGGVVPEIASRAHLERILPVIVESIDIAKISLDEIDAIAVGNRPGLIGSLLVGVAAAKTLAWTLSKPLIAVDHVVAHLCAPALNGAEISYPALGIVVSGGHTSLLLLSDASTAVCLGKTIDDAAGEAFDKAASILGLGWPGGALIDAASKKGAPVHQLPRPKTKGSRPDFSFSGLKTALLYGVRGNPIRKDGKSIFPRAISELSEQEIFDWASSFQEAAVDTIINGIQHALGNNRVLCIVAGGGVLANTLLRKKLSAVAGSYNIPIHLPDIKYCVDNAAMIAGLGYHLFEMGHRDQLNVTASPKGIAS